MMWSSGLGRFEAPPAAELPATFAAEKEEEFICRIEFHNAFAGTLTNVHANLVLVVGMEKIYITNDANAFWLKELPKAS